MGSFTLYKIDSTTDKCQKEIFEPSDDTLEILFRFIDGFDNSVFKFFVFGYGSNTKQAYLSIGQTVDGVKVHWTGIKGPAWLKIIGSIIPSHDGLLEVDSMISGRHVMKILGEQSMVGLFVCHKKYALGLLEYIRKSKSIHPSPEEYLCQFDEVYAIIVDNDNFETKSGRLAIIMYGAGFEREHRNIMNSNLINLIPAITKK